jgi:hypothetical protein
MTDLATACSTFLSRVESYAEGQSSRFAHVLDELIEWSAENDLDYTPHSGAADVIKFTPVGSKMAFWTVTPRSSDGAKFTLLNDSHFPEALRTEARNELAALDKRAATQNGIPEVAFTKLVWEPYRVRVLALMDRLLAGIRNPEGTLAAVA